MGVLFEILKDFNPTIQAIRRRSNKAMIALTTQAMKDTAKYVPMRTGSLKQRTRLGDDALTILYPGPYARFLYGGKVMVYPPTGSTWAPYGKHKEITLQNLKFNKKGNPKAQARWFEASKKDNLQKWIRVAQRAINKYG